MSAWRPAGILFDMTQALSAAIAAHRFGLGEADLDVVGADARGWLLSQIGAADPQRGDDLVDASEGLRRHDAFVRRLRSRDAVAMTMDGRPVEQGFVEHFRDVVQADLFARLGTAVATQRPFIERLALFWSNHFTVSMAKASVRGLVGSFEREAIRPHIAGHFEHLLAASTRHAAMLRYLDNALSAGPHSRFVMRLARRPRDDDDRGPRITGLNENLAREILELHTLGVDGGYTQADVTAFASVLTGWRAPRLPRGSEASFFDPAWHEPGPKTVLGKTYREGPDALDQVLRDLTQHPSTARFIATKLARHFVADDPPPALVARLARAFAETAGHLPTVYSELVRSPEAWTAQPSKLKSPEEFVISTARLLPRGEAVVARGRDGGISQLGQRVQAAPSPAGWPDRADEWLGPEAVWKRLEWATRVGERYGRVVDARRLARQALGPLLGDASRAQIERAADGAQALALLLLAPEFQRR
jgi:uncharacterized protein (DUF1800 family)